jgi:hypothetical protein
MDVDRRKQGEGDITEMENSCNGFLLRFITDITEFYSRYYATFLRILLNLNQDTKKSLEPLIFEKTLEKSSRFITDITE